MSGASRRRAAQSHGMQPISGSGPAGPWTFTGVPSESEAKSGRWDLRPSRRADDRRHGRDGHEARRRDEIACGVRRAGSWAVQSGGPGGPGGPGRPVGGAGGKQGRARENKGASPEDQGLASLVSSTGLARRGPDATGGSSKTGFAPLGLARMARTASLSKTVTTLSDRNPKCRRSWPLARTMARCTSTLAHWRSGAPTAQLAASPAGPALTSSSLLSLAGPLACRSPCRFSPLLARSLSSSLLSPSLYSPTLSHFLLRFIPVESHSPTAPTTRTHQSLCPRPPFT